MGLLTLKRQNLTNLLPYALDNFRNLYIFKGGGANTIGTVFNKDDFIKDDFASLADRLRIFSPDLTTSINYYVRFTENRWTRSNPTNPDATNVVIAENSPIQILTDSNPSLNLPKSINNGAIVQRYYGGKVSLKKSNLSKLISTGSFIFVRGSNNTIGTFSNGSEFVNNNNLGLADLISIKSPGAGDFTSYYFRADGINWRKAGSSVSQNDTVILDGSIIVYTTYNSVLKEFTVQGNNIVRVN